MTTSRKIKSIPALAEYFGTTESPVIRAEFRPDAGWYYTGWNKRVSASWLRKLRAEGVTGVSVAMRDEQRAADFSITELLASARRKTR